MLLGRLSSMFCKIQIALPRDLYGRHFSAICSICSSVGIACKAQGCLLRLMTECSEQLQLTLCRALRRNRCRSIRSDTHLQLVQGLKALPHTQVPNRQDVEAATVEHRKHID